MIRKALRISEQMNLELNLRRSYTFYVLLRREQRRDPAEYIGPLSLSPFEPSLPLI
jgi:hypothetical protein